MSANAKYLAVLAVLATIFGATIVRAAPTFRVERTILPETDSTYELGTSTRSWLRVNTDELCLTGDCKVAWPSGGGSGTVATSSSETLGFIPVWSTTNGTPAKLTGGTSGLKFATSTNRLGIALGSASAQNTLDVGGGMAIGSGYAGTFAAPTNGLIVQGSMSVGSSGANSKFNVVSTTAYPSEMVGASTNTTGPYGVGLRFGNTSATNGNYAGVLIQDANNFFVSGLQAKITDHTSHIGELVLSTRGSGDTDAVERVRVNKTGMGVGINDPLSRLHVRNTTSGGSPTLILEGSTADNLNYPILQFKGGVSVEGGYYPSIELGNAGTSLNFIGGQSGGQRLFLGFNASYGIIFGTMINATLSSVSGVVSPTTGNWWLGANDLTQSSSAKLYVVATSTNPAAAFMGGNVGIGTSTPSSLLHLFSTGTTTLSVDSNSATAGGCLEIKDRSGVGYTYLTAEDGVLTASTVSCK